MCLADLHPGNIMVRVVDPNSLWGRIAHFFDLNTSPHLVLLDVGMTAELSPHDQQHIISFFKVRSTRCCSGSLGWQFCVMS